jgi:hypothetical protein
LVGVGVAVDVPLGVALGVGVGVGEALAEGDGVGEGELDGVGRALGAAGAVTPEEGSGEEDGTGVPVGEAGWLVSDADTSTGAAGGGAAASEIPATIAARPPTAPMPSNTGVQEEALLGPGSGPEPGPATVIGCLPVVRPTTRRSSRPMVATSGERPVRGQCPPWAAAASP